MRQILKSSLVLLFFYSVSCFPVQTPVIEVVDDVVTASCTAPAFRTDDEPLSIDEITGFNFYYGRLANPGEASVLAIVGNECKAILPISKSGVYQAWVTAVVADKEGLLSSEVQFTVSPNAPNAVTNLAMEIK